MTCLIRTCKYDESSLTQLDGPGAVPRSHARPSGMRTVVGSILKSGNIFSRRLVMQ